MRFAFPFLLIGLFTATASAGDLNSQLLSERAVLVAPGTAPEVTTYLSETQNALICIPGGSDDGTTSDRWPALYLPAMPSEPAAARDSMAAWRDRFGISVAFAPGSDDEGAWSQAAAVDGIAYYRHALDFQRGDFALPVGTGYEVYRGPAGPIFSDRISRLQRLRLSAVTPANARGYTELSRQGDAIDATFKGSDAPDRAAIDILLLATEVADSIGNTSDTAATLARLYGRRWGHYLGWLLTPDIENANFELFSGIAQTGTLVFKSSAAVPVSLRRVTLTPASTLAEWQVPFPQTLPPGGRATVPVRLTAGPAAAGAIGLECRFEYRGLIFDRHLSLALPVTEPLELRFDPPILFITAAVKRNDPDYKVSILPGNLVVRNRSNTALDLQLDWSAESPVSIAATDRSLALAAGETRELAFTLSIPLSLNGGDYELTARAANATGLEQSARGSLWSQTASIDRSLKVGVLGGKGPWLGALKALGIGGYPLVASALGQADLSGLHAVIVPAAVDPPDAAAAAVLSDFAGSGRLVLVEMAPAVTRWLPWETPLISRPGPYAASFYDESLVWWEVPDRLVGGCFAATGSTPVYTLPAGSTGWEPLLIDEGGKGFMYRRAQGRGWFVAVHNAWAPRFEKLDRRALMGLISLVGTKRN